MPKEEKISLPNNLEMAKHRIASLKRRLLRDSSLKKNYIEVINSYLSKGHAKQLSSDICQDQTKNVWYLPHHPVIHPHKSKIRVVFDCAAKFHNVSLNDQLLSGPDLTNSLVGVLIRFRKEPIVLVADVEQMFHQVKVNPEDREALRFLWWPQGNLDEEPVPHQMTVHIFGAKSSPCCANFCLQQTAKEFGCLYDSQISEIIYNCFYVDDCLVSLPSVEQAIAAQRCLSELLSKRGFRLRKWVTNNDDVLRRIPECERATSVCDHALDDTKNARLLGMLWKLKEDAFVFVVNLPRTPLTRRGLLSALSSLFDPLGFVSPVILEGKLLLQELCKRKADWDEEITSEEAQRWLSWTKLLTALNDVRIPRCFRPSDFGAVKHVEIHNFSDASSVAYGACSYVRLVSNADACCCSMVIGKARLAPIKAVSIPRLELTAAVLAVRLNNIVKKELDIRSQCVSKFWTDSTAVLHCIRNKTKRFAPFVANRLATIERDSDGSVWNYVPSKQNPADIASRGISPYDTSNLQTWLGGPSFLLDLNFLQNWNVPGARVLPSEFLPKDEKKNCACVKVITENGIDRLIESCSTLHKLKRLTAWLLRFINYLRSRVRKETLDLNKLLSTSELNLAEMAQIRYLQRKSLPMFFKNAGNAQLKSLPRVLQKLRPVVMDGVVRVGGRLSEAPIEFDMKHPIVVPQHSRFTELLIQQHHLEVGHSGACHTWASLRRKYWIIKGSAAVRKSIGKCISCVKRNSAVGKQLMADLPSCRLQFDKPPFSCTGVDYFGPLSVKQGRSVVKRYGCVFTCLTTRAVHIEIAHSLNTDSFINALRRFIARRGRPSSIFSDNGTNFVGAEKVLREALQAFDSDILHRYCLQQNIDWHFNPPAASHMGGAWERMIRSIRRILQSLLGSQSLNDVGCLTLMAEVEGILNSRPLLPISFTDYDQEPLTPNHILLLQQNPNLPPGAFSKDAVYSRRRWAQVQYLANQFWKRWINEFLPNLLHRQKWFEKKKNMQVNDIVLVVEDMKQRSKWVMGRVLKTFPDKNGLVRTALIKTQNSTLKRPITMLCPIVGSEPKDL